MDDVLRKAPLLRHEHRHVPGLNGKGHGGVSVVALLGDNALNGLGGGVGRAEPAVLYPQIGCRAHGHHPQGQIGHGSVQKAAGPAAALPGGKASPALLVQELLPHPLQVFRAGGQGLQVGPGLPLGDARLFQGAFRQPLGPQGRGAQHPGALLPGKAQPLPAEQGGLVGQAQLHHLAQGVRQGKGQGPGDFL